MDGVRIAEQVVEVAENLLVGADEEDAEEVVLAIGLRVQLEHVLDVAQIDERIDLAVRVARDVGERGAVRGLLVEPVDRADREQLIDRPRIGHRLEHREVAEVRVAERLLEALELLGHVRHVAREVQHLLARGPEEVLAEHAVLEREVPEVEQLEDLILVLDGVVIALEEVLGGDALKRLPHVVDERRHRLRERRRHLRLELGHAEDVDDEHGVVRGDRAARLADDVRVRDLIGVADLLDREHHVVRVLLHRVVHRRAEVRLRTVVVNAEPAADIEVRQALRAHLVQLDEQPAGLAQRVLHALDRADLRAEVEVEELDAIGLAPRLELSDRVDHLGGREPELREVTARLLPAACAT